MHDVDVLVLAVPVLESMGVGLLVDVTDGFDLALPLLESTEATLLVDDVEEVEVTLLEVLLLIVPLWTDIPVEGTDIFGIVAVLLLVGMELRLELAVSLRTLMLCQLPLWSE